jgi:hypothetical protein
MLVPCLAYSLALKMEATCMFETSVDFQQTTWHYIPENRTVAKNICHSVFQLYIYAPVIGFYHPSIQNCFIVFYLFGNTKHSFPVTECSNGVKTPK